MCMLINTRMVFLLSKSYSSIFKFWSKYSFIPKDTLDDILMKWIRAPWPQGPVILDRLNWYMVSNFSFSIFTSCSRNVLISICTLYNRHFVVSSKTWDLWSQDWNQKWQLAVEFAAAYCTKFTGIKSWYCVANLKKKSYWTEAIKRTFLVEVMNVGK